MEDMLSGDKLLLLSKIVTVFMYVPKSISIAGSVVCPFIVFTTKILITRKLIGIRFCKKNNIQLRIE